MYFALMVPQYQSGKILILATDLSYHPKRLKSFILNLKKLTLEETTSYPDFEGHEVTFPNNQFKISDDGQTIVTIAGDLNRHCRSSEWLIEFKIASNEVKKLEEIM